LQNYERKVVSGLRTAQLSQFERDIAKWFRTLRPIHYAQPPVADPRHQLDAEHMRERENGFGLSLRVGVENVGLDIAFVFEQPTEDVDRFPDTAWNDRG
jgi:hypothetical protein